MSCSTDAYYNTPIPVPDLNGKSSCGEALAGYSSCVPYGTYGGSAPWCCPEGYEHSIVRGFIPGDTGYNSCKWSGANIGKRFKCIKKQPEMTDVSKANCCGNQEFPGNTAEGYCAIGWCPGSDKCISFMQSNCVGSKLGESNCQEFCKKNPGKCDRALLNFCSKSENFGQPVCGCTMPTSQYPLSKFIAPGVPTIPKACDIRCSTVPQALRTLDQPACSINTICVQNVTELNIAKSATGNDPSINITQDCGNVKPTPGPIPGQDPQQSSGFPRWLLIVIAVAALILVIVGLIFLLVGNNKPKISVSPSSLPKIQPVPSLGIIDL